MKKEYSFEFLELLSAIEHISRQIEEISRNQVVIRVPEGATMKISFDGPHLDGTKIASVG